MENYIQWPKITWDEAERNMIISALKRNNGNRTYASNELGISIRTIRNKIRKYKKQGHDIPVSISQGRHKGLPRFRIPKR